MLVVIPVCHKDEELVLKNLDWVAELDGKIEAECSISCPEGFAFRAVSEKAMRIFSGGVVMDIYSEWGGDPKWPQPQNWAWQSTARHMARQPLPWLWWEADSTPVRKGWIEALRKEYEAGGKPFMGYVTDQNGTEPHMAGVGVYPPEVARYSINAMLCRAMPFDVMLARDTLAQTHKANHLIQHHVHENGDSTHFPTSASVDEIIQPGVVLFHRCKDGSLIDRLRDPRSVSGMLKSLFAKPKPKPRTWPSITKQTPWKCGLFDLPSHNTECHFNCALTEQNKTLWLVSRRWRRTGFQPWQSDIVRHSLGENLTITKSVPIVLPKQCGVFEQHEDPRIIQHGPGFLLGYCSWLMGARFQAHQALATLDSQWNCVSTLHLRYGNNGPYPGAGTGHEKNWTWFIHEGQLHLDYQFSPHIVVALDDKMRQKEHKTPTPLEWKYGHIRGGTPPVKVGDEYVSFFHSSMPWRQKQNRYFMGAFAFEAKPPFAVTRITPEPLLAGSDEDLRTLGGPLVVFPCGALLDTVWRMPNGVSNQFIVTLGVNDQSCAWIEIPLGELFDKM